MVYSYIYIIGCYSKSISSIQLSKDIGVTQKTAWFMLHRLREAKENGFVKFVNIMGIDETYLGLKEKNKHYDKRTKYTQRCIYEFVFNFNNRKLEVEDKLQTILHNRISMRLTYKNLVC